MITNHSLLKLTIRIRRRCLGKGKKKIRRELRNHRQSMVERESFLAHQNRVAAANILGLFTIDPSIKGRMRVKEEKGQEQH